MKMDLPVTVMQAAPDPVGCTVLWRMPLSRPHSGAQGAGETSCPFQKGLEQKQGAPAESRLFCCASLAYRPPGLTAHSAVH